MTFTIYGTDKNGKEDSFNISGDSLEIIKGMAFAEVNKRGWTNPRSEQIS